MISLVLQRVMVRSISLWICSLHIQKNYYTSTSYMCLHIKQAKFYFRAVVTKGEFTSNSHKLCISWLMWCYLVGMSQHSRGKYCHHLHARSETNCGRALLYRRWRKKKQVIQNGRPVNMRILGIGHGDLRKSTLSYMQLFQYRKKSSERLAKQKVEKKQPVTGTR